MNKLVIFNYSLKRALNSSFKCYEFTVRERAHVLIPSRGANGMVSKRHVILSPTPASHSSNFKTCRLLALQCHLVEYSKTINLSSTAVEQVVACVLVTQWAWVRSLVGTSFLGEVFRVFPHLYDECQEALGPQSP